MTCFSPLTLEGGKKTNLVVRTLSFSGLHSNFSIRSLKNFGFRGDVITGDLVGKADRSLGLRPIPSSSNTENWSSMVGTSESGKTNVTKNYELFEIETTTKKVIFTDFRRTSFKSRRRKIFFGSLGIVLMVGKKF